MDFSPKRSLVLRITTITGFVFAGIFGLSLGLALAGTTNARLSESTEKLTEAVGTKILDIKGRVITEFFSDEKRDLIPLSDMPKHLIDALIVREDADFWHHSGFSPRGFSRALWGIVSDTLVSGGSTLTQQLAKMQYLNPRDKTLLRKIVELWYAFQLERRFTKQEILQLYLNKMPFGHGAYGVEAASRFFFKKSVRDITPAESAILAIQLVMPNLYSPIRNPEGARDRSRLVLDLMVEGKLLSKEEADNSFNQYWESYDYGRSSSETLFTTRPDQAPYFSEYIRGRLESLLPENANIYKDGYTVYTTLNLDYQKIAEKEFYQGLATAGRIYADSTSVDSTSTVQALIPQMEALGLVLGLKDIRFTGKQRSFDAKQYLQKKVYPIIDLSADLFGLSALKPVTDEILDLEKTTIKKNVVEGAMIALDNKSGHILVMIGGSPFTRQNQFNRAVLARVQPGSAYKPLYYAVAVDDKKITAGTLLVDGPRTFPSPDGTTYAPFNYGGKWYGSVLTRQALALSLNIPALQVLEAAGFDAVIDKTSRMLGFRTQKEVDTIPRNYPLGLGTLAVSPLQLARSYTTFPNGGKPVDPISIRYVTDRAGNTVVNPEADLINQQQAQGASRQVISPQAAYVMSTMLKASVEYGTLYGATTRAGGFGAMDMAGKTGTTQNWSDAWALGFSPYITAAVWYGFDTPGNSLGIANNGSQTSAPVWANFMKQVHSTLPAKRFERPGSGLVDVVINTETGLLPVGYPGEKTRVEVFIAGTAPTTSASEILSRQSELSDEALKKLHSELTNAAAASDSLGAELDLDLYSTVDIPTQDDSLDFLLESPAE